MYHDNQLIKTFKTEEQTSEVLPSLFENILKEYDIKRLFFARGPGSFMAIKITYIFLKTLSISLDIPLLACEGFEFNNNQPIRAMRSLYFVRECGEIKSVKLDEVIEQKFELPLTLDEKKFSENNEPLYMLPAV